LTFERRLFLLALCAGLPAVGCALFLLWFHDYSAGTRWTVGAILVLCWVGFAAAVEERVGYAIRTLANLLSALTEGDFSFRLRQDNRGALGEVYQQINQMAGTLHEQRLGAMEAAALLQKVIGEIVRDYTKLDSKDSGYFTQQKARFETRGLAQYKRLIATIKRRYHGVSVGASESIFAPLAQALGLRLLTPPSFLKAISEGTEPTAGDKTTIDRQIAKREIKVWVFNSQNSTPDVQRITDAARKKGMPVTTITETLTPTSASFQNWQSRQLEALAAALAKATGR